MSYLSYCLHPSCPQPQNKNNGKFCQTCGAKLLLKERYRAIKPIGQGGFGRTFLAVDEDKPSKPRCVIKQFYPQAQGTSTVQKAVELFNQEAMRLDELGKHPQIPELLAYFTQDDRQYLVQEFIDGQNLGEELAAKGAFNEMQIRQLLNNLLSVLQFCHARQVIHRDIKPENIIRRRFPLEGEENQHKRDLFLVDFGASKIVTHTALNRTGTSIGSPEYVAPEQMRGQAIFASDIYSLGATSVRLLTERSPFDLYDINNATWVWQHYVKNPVSEELSGILNKMLQTIPAQRYQTTDEVLKDLNKKSSVATSISLPAKPIVTSPPATPTSTLTHSHNPIEKELEEMRTTFLGSHKSANNKTTRSPQPSANQPAPNSKIDEELEELRAKYLDNNNSPDI
ncbi:MAG: serine/threonine protein kinase [Pelatocladus maniniholoensis HA4357-MV3]|jgi:serine/threonine protein kinase|uniref:non-specific serine/threonine protein kinase n=1 Tax=Pelatocladus maniniholoensis HA4357-MV3 TaxID=1117104 RepID=A0A9E3H7Y5_9NOST|nr:serine/threonine protein kinase [Pelatocladus maniniholoensis HA4357-MV3]